MGRAQRLELDDLGLQLDTFEDIRIAGDECLGLGRREDHVIHVLDALTAELKAAQDGLGREETNLASYTEQLAKTFEHSEALLSAQRELARIEQNGESDLRRVFRQGVVVEALNPKTAIFFLAFLPQFVDPARGALHWQILILGFTFMGPGIMSDGMFALTRVPSASLSGLHFCA